MSEPLNVLFLCPDNACRSIMAEVLLNKVGQGRFKAYSAAPDPAGRVNVYAEETLKQVGYDVSGKQPQTWDKFVVPTAPRLDAVITLSESLRDARLPIWFSNPVRVHWGFAAPEKVEGEDFERVGAFRRCYGNMEQQMLKLAGLKVNGVRGLDLEQMLMAIAP